MKKIILFCLFATTLAAYGNVEEEFKERLATFISERNLRSIDQVFQVKGDSRFKSISVWHTFEKAMILGVESIDVEKLDEDSRYWPKEKYELDGVEFAIDSQGPFWLVSIEYKTPPEGRIPGASLKSSTVASLYDGKLKISNFRKIEK